MSKYIIKNCPCFFEENEEVNDYTCTWNGTKELACQDCTDCAMKQIVELYKEQTQFCKDCSTSTCENCDFSTNGFAEEVIELLNIQEVE